MFKDPVEQSFLKSDVVAGLLTFEPFMTKDLFALREIFAVKRRIFYEVEDHLVFGRTHIQSG